MRKPFTGCAGQVKGTLTTPTRRPAAVRKSQTAGARRKLPFVRRRRELGAARAAEAAVRQAQAVAGAGSLDELPEAVAAGVDAREGGRPGLARQRRCRRAQRAVAAGVVEAAEGGEVACLEERVDDRGGGGVEAE